MFQRVRTSKKQKHFKSFGFVEKLWKLLNDGNTENLISWSSDSEKFLIHDIEKFTQQVLSKVFNHHNYSSFIRQLNIYGFIKVKNEENTYHHPLFNRYSPELVGKIKRKDKGGRKIGVGNQRQQNDEEKVQLQIEYGELKEKYQKLLKQKQGLILHQNKTKQSIQKNKNNLHLLIAGMVDSKLKRQGDLEKIKKSNNQKTIFGNSENETEEQRKDEEKNKENILSYLHENKIYRLPKIKEVLEEFVNKERKSEVQISENDLDEIIGVYKFSD